MNIMRSAISGKRGFTLIEVLVAILFLVIGLLGLLSLTTTVIKGNAFSKMTTMATTLAKAKLEDVKSQSYTDVATSTDYATSSGTVSGSSSGALYTRTCTVTGDSPAANMKTISVQVTWLWNGTSRSVSTSTIISR
jgi:type IV pilus assembly protein PilV